MEENQPRANYWTNYWLAAICLALYLGNCGRALDKSDEHLESIKIELQHTNQHLENLSKRINVRNIDR